MAAVANLALVDPQSSLLQTAYAAALVGLAGETFDIVIDAYRIELLKPRQLGVGSGMSQYCWRIGSVAAGEIGRANVCNPVTNAPLVCGLLFDKNKSTLNSRVRTR